MATNLLVTVSDRSVHAPCASVCVKRMPSFTTTLAMPFPDSSVTFPENFRREPWGVVWQAHKLPSASPSSSILVFIFLIILIIKRLHIPCFPGCKGMASVLQNGYTPVTFPYRGHALPPARPHPAHACLRGRLHGACSERLRSGRRICSEPAPYRRLAHNVQI